MIRRRTLFTLTGTLLTATLLTAACASAGKRLEQGLEAESAGSFYAASMRYVEALEKDADLTEARDRLQEAGDSAIVVGLADIEADARAGDDVAAAEGYRSLDRLVARARSVGVRLNAPGEYAAHRREAFDRAIDALSSDAQADREAGRWSAARGSLARIRRDFEPSAAQRSDSETAEAALLLEWAGAEADAGRARRAYDLAGEALDAASPVPADVADGAEALRARAVAEGTRALAVLPVSSTAAVRDAAESDVEQQLSDVLELDHWRAPPLFVVVADPVLVRQAVRRWAPPGTRPRPGRILDEVGADFGVLIELVDLTTVERDVRQEQHQGRAADGRPAAWTEERGRRVLTVEARASLVDATGREVAEARARESADGRFERGIYAGDPRNLDLSRRERTLFDPMVLRRQRADLEAEALGALAERLADQVFSRVLSRIP